MQAKKAKPARQPARAESADLDVRYGKIGISAVAAAMRFRGEPRKAEASLREPPRNSEWRVASSE